MYSILTGSIIISLLHAVIPNHWLPVLAIGRKEKWTIKEVTEVTLIAALAHALSTVAIGLVLGFLGKEMEESIGNFTRYAAPVILIVLGIIFIYRHHHHQHFHLDGNIQKKHTKRRIITALTVAMFFSPCMEIEAYFLLAGTYAQWLVWTISFLYVTITTLGMILLVRLAYSGLLRLNWHSLEHNAGIITGITLILTGIVSFFIH